MFLGPLLPTETNQKEKKFKQKQQKRIYSLGTEHEKNY